MFAGLKSRLVLWSVRILGAAPAVTTIAFADTVATQSSSGTVLGDYAVTYPAGGTRAPPGKYAATWNPSVTVHSRVPGTFNTGDLFVISNASNFDGNVLVTVSLTNTGQLASTFSYLNLGIGLYYNTGTASRPTWALLSEQYLSLVNGSATWIVPAADYYDNGGGNGELSISVDGGDFYATSSGSFSINTFATVAPAQGNL